jgi:hypothetical protein
MRRELRFWISAPQVVLAVFSSFSIDIVAWCGNFLGAKPALKKT